MKYPIVFTFTVALTLVSTAVLLGIGYSFGNEKRVNRDELLHECFRAAQETQDWALTRVDSTRSDPYTGVTFMDTGYSPGSINSGSLQLDRMEGNGLQFTCSNTHFGNRVVLQVRGLRAQDIYLVPSEPGKLSNTRK